MDRKWDHTIERMDEKNSEEMDNSNAALSQAD